MIEHKDTVNEEIREKYPECYISIETSAKSYSSISKLFQITEQVILYPASPLYDSLQGALTPEFMRVLKLIFRRLDKDRDNRLNVLETQDLNRDTYHQNLNIKEVNALFSMITEVCPYGIDDKGIKFEGFCKLQELLIRKLKTKNCWTLVKYFGFDESLTLENKFRANFTDGRTVEISDNCVQFLVEIFNQFSVDSLLTRDEIIELFSTLTTPPWMAEDAESWDDYAEYVQTTTDKELSLSSWISL